MRKFLVAPALLFALTAAAEDAYQFRLRLTDGRTGLMANPQFEKMQMPADQLERAAQSRVLVLDRVSGAHWVWLMLSAAEHPVEQRINATGGGGLKESEADLGLTAQADGTVAVRCIRQRCDIRITRDDVELRSVSMTLGEIEDLPLDAHYDIVFRDTK